MKELLKMTDDYMKSSSWKELALIKLCMCSVGMLIGMLVCKKHKKAVGLIAVGIFIITVIPLMLGFLKSVKK